MARELFGGLGPVNPPRPIRTQMDPAVWAQILSSAGVAREQAKAQANTTLFGLPGQLVGDFADAKNQERLFSAQKEKSDFERVGEDKKRQKMDLEMQEIQMGLRPVEEVQPDLVKKYPELKGAPMKMVPSMISSLTSLQKTGQPKPFTLAENDSITNLNSALREVQRARTILEADPGSFKASRTPIIGTAFNKNAQELKKALSEIADVKTRKRTGAALNLNEMAEYERQIGEYLDNPDTILSALTRMETLFTEAKTRTLAGRPDPLAQQFGPKTKSGKSFEERYKEYEQKGVPKDKIFSLLANEGY